MQDVCFLTRDGIFPFILGADFNFPPSLWQDLSLHGGGVWIKQLDASVVIPEGSSHTCRTGRGQKPGLMSWVTLWKLGATPQLNTLASSGRGGQPTLSGKVRPISYETSSG